VDQERRALVDAADQWLAAIEAQELYGATPSLEEELAEAEARLAAAVRAWREARGRQFSYDSASLRRPLRMGM
jgi:hypothetical protein